MNDRSTTGHGDGHQARPRRRALRAHAPHREMTYDAAPGMDTDATSVGDAADRTAELVQRAVAGDDRAFGALYEAWFDRVYDRAYGVVRDHSLAAEVAQDTFLRAWQQLPTVRDPTVFGGWLLRIARNTALNRLRTERRTTAVDDAGLAMIERAGPAPAAAPAGFRVEDRLSAADDPSSAAEDAELVALVTEAAAALDGRDAEVLDLGLRLGLTPAEIGEAVGLNRNAANQAVHRARRRLRTAVEARVLWRRGRPDCPDLVAALAAAGVERFGADAVAVADAHAGGCARCAEQRRLRLDPAVLFGAVPLVGAPALLKAQIAQALAGQGVPVAGTGADGPGAGGSHGPGGSAGGTGAGDPGADGSADGDPGAGPLPGPVAARRGRRLALVAGGGLVLLAAVGGILALVEAPGEGEPRRGVAPATRPADRAPAPTTVAVPTVPTTVPTSPPPRSGPAGTTAGTAPPRLVEPPVTVAPTEPPPPPATGSIAVTPATRSGSWPMSASDAPRLTWTSAHAASVTVEGPGVSSTAASGSVVVCPPSGASGPACPTPPPGPYRYRLTLRDGSGAVVLTQDAVLTVAP